MYLRMCDLPTDMSPRASKAVYSYGKNMYWPTLDQETPNRPVELMTW